MRPKLRESKCKWRERYVKRTFSGRLKELSEKITGRAEEARANAERVDSWLGKLASHCTVSAGVSDSLARFAAWKAQPQGNEIPATNFGLTRPESVRPALSLPILLRITPPAWQRTGSWAATSDPGPRHHPCCHAPSTSQVPEAI